MTKEQLEKANDIATQINRLSKKLETLSESSSKEDGYYITITNTHICSDVCITDDIFRKSDFDEIFALARYRVMNKLRALKSELENL